MPHGDGQAGPLASAVTAHCIKPQDHRVLCWTRSEALREKVTLLNLEHCFNTCSLLEIRMGSQVKSLLSHGRYKRKGLLPSHKLCLLRMKFSLSPNTCLSQRRGWGRSTSASFPKKVPSYKQLEAL